MKRLACIMMISISILSWAASANAQAVSVSDDTATLLKKSVGEKEAIIWYMGQDAFAIKTKSHLLILDPYNAGMWLSYKPVGSLAGGQWNAEELKDQNVIVFSSSLLDYNPGMWDWQHYIKQINFVFGWDLVSSRPYVKYTYVKPRSEAAVDGVQVTSIQATEIGSGFLLKVDGITIFFGGNHAVLEPGEMAAFTKEIDFVAGKAKPCDLVFLEFQAGSGQRQPAMTKGIWYAAQKLSPQAIFPMGAYENRGRSKSGVVSYEKLIPDLIKEAPTAEIGSKIVQTEKAGKVFIYRDGKIISQ
jgi:hypothetical protein